jgi:hypothetical protein
MKQRKAVRRLSPCEREALLKMVSIGVRPKVIAEHLNLDLSTVYLLRRSLLRELAATATAPCSLPSLEFLSAATVERCIELVGNEVCRTFPAILLKAILNRPEFASASDVVRENFARHFFVAIENRFPSPQTAQPEAAPAWLN